MDATLIRYFRIGFILWNAFISAVGIFAIVMLIFAMPWQGIEEYEDILSLVFLMTFIAVYALVSFLNAKLQLRKPSASLICCNAAMFLIVLGLILLGASVASSAVTLLLPLAGNSIFCFMILLCLKGQAVNRG